MTKRFLVTGGAGFIGSAVVRRLIGTTPHEVLVVDKLTYAGNLDSLAPVAPVPYTGIASPCSALMIASGISFSGK
ncbi:NAD-dependent epimerase/dehydratase family protein [Rhodopseudomonas palustris]|nr:hypothetical protein B1S06_01775 [Rhodopseudomonas palustris]